MRTRDSFSLKCAVIAACCSPFNNLPNETLPGWHQPILADGTHSSFLHIILGGAAKAVRDRKVDLRSAEDLKVDGASPSTEPAPGITTTRLPHRLVSPTRRNSQAIETRRILRMPLRSRLSGSVKPSSKSRSASNTALTCASISRSAILSFEDTGQLAIR